jgi:hypothetical protein
MPLNVTYLNPQLKSQTENAILMLKSWTASESVDILTKEKYGEDICDCCNNKLKLAVKYVEYMQCYQFSYSYTIINENDTVETVYEYPYNCLTEEELKTLLEKSKLVTTQKC